MNSRKDFKTRSGTIIAIVSTLTFVALLAMYGMLQQGPPAKDLIAGVVTLDLNGEATITLPTAVTAQRTDFGYQAKSMDTPMPNLYIKSDPQQGRFTIAGGTPGGQVAWQLVGISKAR